MIELNTSESQFLHKIISESNIQWLIESEAIGINESYFTDDNLKRVWNKIIDHKQRFNSIPSLAAVQESIPEFTPGSVPDRFEFYRTKLIGQYQKQKMAGFVTDLASKIQQGQDPNDCIEFIGEMYKDLIKAYSLGDFGRFREMLQRIEGYKASLAAGVQIHGVPTGIPVLDEHFLGYRPGDSAVIAGRTGEGKTTLALFMAHSAFMSGRKVSYITLEMPREQIFEKLDALATQISIDDLKKMRLTEQQLDLYENIAERIASMPRHNDINVHDRTGSCTVATVESILNTDQPDILYVDSIYLMKSLGKKSNWEGMKEISNELKQLAMTYRTPIVSLSQLNRPGAETIKTGELPTLDNLSFSDSIGFDADHVFVITSNKSLKAAGMKRLSTMKLRGASELDMVVKWNPKTNFIEYQCPYYQWRLPSTEVAEIQAAQDTFTEAQSMFQPPNAQST